jgi:hypothetical protein
MRLTDMEPYQGTRISGLFFFEACHSTFGLS